MKRAFLSFKGYILLVLIVTLLAAALYFAVSKHGTKIPERALFVKIVYTKEV